MKKTRRGTLYDLGERQRAVLETVWEFEVGLGVRPKVGQPDLVETQRWIGVRSGHPDRHEQVQEVLDLG